MKIGLKNIMVLLALLLGGSSCDSFLDVQPKGEVLEGDLLKDAKGFENALYGVYAKMGCKFIKKVRWGQLSCTGRI